MARVLIRNGMLIDPSQNIEKICDILIQDGIVIKVGENISDQTDRVIEAQKMLVLPGLVDMHVHLRDPGFTQKEDIYTGSNAALCGGVSSILCMPNTNPVIDCEEVIDYINNLANTARTKVYMCGAITQKMQGEKLADFALYKKKGVLAVSDDGRPVKDDELMKKAMISAYENGLPIISHCEDLAIIDGGIINKGEVSEKLGVKGMDRASENNITAREIRLAKETNTAIHIAHVSTKESVDLIRKAKQEGVKVTCETAPHYFCFTQDKLLTKDADYRMNPPLREQDDVN
ncbi:MAG: amidohydrolase family protein, partial [Oscillospiraceae bacterium]